MTALVTTDNTNSDNCYSKDHGSDSSTHIMDDDQRRHSLTSAAYTRSSIKLQEKLTRKSIKKYFPLGQIMSKGQNNPLTLHSVNQDVFSRLWSFMAEVMVADGALTRSQKEAVALLVSEKNQCPMCVTAHRMMGAAAKRAEDSALKGNLAEQQRQHAIYLQTMNYAETIILDTIQYRPHKKRHSILATHTDYSGMNQSMADFMNSSADLNDKYNHRRRRRRSTGHLLDDLMEESDEMMEASESEQDPKDQVPKDDDRLLTDEMKAEIALVVVLYFHMNRIISAVLGEQMSTAMFSVPESAAKRMEAPKVMSVVNKMMAPLLATGMKPHSYKPGITAGLFPEGSSSCLEFMPRHLQGAALAGDERANALARLVAWSKTYEHYLLQNNIITKEVIDFLDNPARSPPEALRPQRVATWATTEMRKLIRVCLRHETSSQQAMANVLCLVSYSPPTVYQSTHWQTVVQAFGEEQAKTIVLWWSLRETLKRAQGLKVPKHKRSSLRKQ